MPFRCRGTIKSSSRHNHLFEEARVSVRASSSISMSELSKAAARRRPGISQEQTRTRHRGRISLCV